MVKKRFALLLIALMLLIAGSGAVYAATRCSACMGKGYRICTPCTGTGRLRTGTVTNSQGTKVVYGLCLTCKGSGRIICISCNGRGVR